MINELRIPSYSSREQQSIKICRLAYYHWRALHVPAKIPLVGCDRHKRRMSYQSLWKSFEKTRSLIFGAMMAKYGKYSELLEVIIWRRIFSDIS